MVILNVKEYIKESERQLNNAEHYRHLEHDGKTENKATVNKVITKFKNDKLISSNVLNGLAVESPRTPCFYIQPKIQNKVNPGKTVISSLNCHTSKIFEYVDFHLQQVVKHILPYVKNTSNILRKLEAIKSVKDNAYLVSLDAKSLCTSIPDAEGIKAVKK